MERPVKLISRKANYRLATKREGVMHSFPFGPKLMQFKMKNVAVVEHTSAIKLFIGAVGVFIMQRQMGFETTAILQVNFQFFLYRKTMSPFDDRPESDKTNTRSTYRSRRPSLSVYEIMFPSDRLPQRPRAFDILGISDEIWER